MKIHKAIIDKDENGVYLQLPYGEKKYFIDDREFMNAYYAHEVLKQFYEQDHRISVLERAIDFIIKTAYAIECENLEDKTDICSEEEYFKKVKNFVLEQAEKELKCQKK